MVAGASISWKAHYNIPKSGEGGRTPVIPLNSDRLLNTSNDNHLRILVKIILGIARLPGLIQVSLALNNEAAGRMLAPKLVNRGKQPPRFRGYQ